MRSPRTTPLQTERAQHRSQPRFRRLMPTTCMMNRFLALRAARRELLIATPPITIAALMLELTPPPMNLCFPCSRSVVAWLCVSVCVCLCLSVCLSLCLSLSVSVSLSLCLSVSLCVRVCCCCTNKQTRGSCNTILNKAGNVSTHVPTSTQSIEHTLTLCHHSNSSSHGCHIRRGTLPRGWQ